MGVTSDIRHLLYRAVSRTKLGGVVGMANCRFVRCRFVQVGFTGSDDMLDQLQSGVTPLSELETGAEPLA